MAHFYSDDRSTQIVLALLKANGIRKVIASPGTTNIALVGSMQIDPFFEIYSSVDERSAAYMACGMSYESGEPVVITCTEATASRNYFPGLTEAYHRKLPILAITGNHGIHRVGHLMPQVIDRSRFPIDTVRISVNIGKCKDNEDEWENNVKVNKAILALTHNGGGPAHINLQFSTNTYNTKSLPPTRVIKRYMPYDNLPEIPKGRIAIFVGSHKPFTKEEYKAINRFCMSHNAAILCDKTSAYVGKYRVDYALISSQMEHRSETSFPDLLIHIGGVSGETYTQSTIKAKTVWRVDEDGEIRDTFKKLESVFQMREMDFFNHYATDNEITHDYLEACKSDYIKMSSQLPEIGFSNIWIAKTLIPQLPKDCVLHLGIYNSLRSWNFFKIDDSIQTICNVGGFGIDGAISTLLGSSLVNKDKLHFEVVGDLAFFYDMNALGNRSLKSNIRLLVVNNGKGAEFRKLDHACRVFGEDADLYMAAAGHYGNKSPILIKSFAESIGFKYLTASSKKELQDVIPEFTDIRYKEKPIILEVFTDSKDEAYAVDAYRHIISDGGIKLKNKVRDVLRIIKK